MQYINYLTFFVSTFVLSVFFILAIRKIALRFNIVDEPGGERKIHSRITPLLGGVAVFLAFFFVLYFARAELLSGNLAARHWLGFFIGACFLMIGGFLDDKYNLKPSRQLIFPILAIASVILGGVSIEKITNPFGGFVYLEILSPIIIALWLLGMMYTTKLLDGLDGLVSGVSAIGGIVIFLFTMTTKYYQPDVGLASLIFAAACLGFLIFNWHPAKIFLGEGGSLLLGYILGVLAIISGGKIAIALLVMGIPIMDVAWTILRRLKEGKNPFKFADRKHLHFRLLETGLGVKKTVLLYYFFSLAFGLLAVFLQSKGKVFALGILVLIMFGAIANLSRLDKKVQKG
jgi:UDP-GlcNAc:undecaprenyl-phosphate GlcNAc-1-phosphate transferase